MRSMHVAIVLLGAALLAGCATHGQSTSVNKSLSQQPDRTLPRRILLAQPDIRVHEISTGEVVEQVDEWSRQASAEAEKSVEAFAQSTNLFELVQPAKLSDAQRGMLEQYSALYALVSGSAELARKSRVAAWRARAADFDYTLGPGMAGIAESAKLDAIVFVVGTDHISSSGRRAAMAVGYTLDVLVFTAMIVGAVMGANVSGYSGGHIGPESKPAFLSAGVVDMHTGELLWYSTEVRGGSDNLRDPAVVKNLVEDLFKTYPGAVKAAHAKK
ncbi:MAG TPA: hypothetical protein VMH26_01250 [Burkholderiales bacterium]|nr:hypothetical protein [Burkholderiales bacterium]